LKKSCLISTFLIAILSLCTVPAWALEEDDTIVTTEDGGDTGGGDTGGGDTGGGDTGGGDTGDGDTGGGDTGGGDTGSGDTGGGNTDAGDTGNEEVVVLDTIVVIGEPWDGDEEGDGFEYYDEDPFGYYDVAGNRVERRWEERTTAERAAQIINQLQARGFTSVGVNDERNYYLFSNPATGQQIWASWNSFGWTFSNKEPPQA
jgi:hypothetical protein